MFEYASRLVEKRLKDNWGATPVCWDDGDFRPVRGVPWIRFQMSWANSIMVGGTADHGVYRENGMITIGVFTVRGTGPRANHSLCDSVANLYRGYSIDKLYCQAPYVIRVGEEKEWFHQNVWIPFYFDNCFEEVV